MNKRVYLFLFCLAAVTASAATLSDLPGADARFDAPDTLELGENTEQVQIPVSGDDTIIYNTAYYSTDNGDTWESFSFENTNSNWHVNTAETDVTITNTDTNQVDILLYSCTWNQGWDCHGQNWQHLTTQLTAQTCEPGQCRHNNTCYNPGQDSPINQTTCTTNGWANIPDQNDVSVTLESATRTDGATQLDFTTNGFDLQQHPYHLHFTTGGQTIKMYNGTSPTTITTTPDVNQVCAYVANKTHGRASQNSCKDIQDQIDQDSLDVEMTKAVRDGGMVTAYFDAQNFTPASDNYHVHFTNGQNLITRHFTDEPATLDTAANEICAFVADADHNAVNSPDCTTVTQPAETGQLWSNPDTWDGSVPTEGDTVTITEDMNVTLDQDTPELDGIKIQGGTLRFARQDLQLTTDYIKATNGGELRIGTEEQPFEHRATITLTGTREQRGTVDHCGIKGICTLGAKLELHGAVRSPTWTQLADEATAQPGETSITVEENVEWRPGDEIVIVSTDYDPGLAERRMVTEVSGNTVYLNESLEYEHYSDKQEFSGTTLDQRAEVIHLTRNIKIQGDTQSTETNFGGHVMAMNEHHKEQMQRNQNGEDFNDLWDEYDNADQYKPNVKGVEFERMGQAGVLARYPFHWHLYGDAEGSYIKDSSIHGSFQRCVTVHGTRNAVVDNNVAFNTTGHCYFLEDGAEADNTITNNIAALVQPFDNSSRELIPSDSRPAGFWFRNVDNNFLNNTAAGVFGYGMWADSLAQGTGNPTGPSATDDINLRRDPPSGEFSGNTLHSIANVWRHPEKNHVHELTAHDTDRQTGAGLFVENLISGDREFPGFTAYHNDGIGLWAASRGDVWINDSITADVPVGIKARARTENITVVGDTANDGNPTQSGSGLVPNEFSYEKTWTEITVDDLHYYENRTGRSLPAVTSFGPPHPDDVPIIGQQNFYTGTVSKGVTYVNFEDQGIQNYSVFHEAPSPEAKGHWHWNTAFQNASMTLAPRGGNGGLNPAMFTLIDGDGSISGDGDYTEYRYYDYVDSLAAHQASEVEYRGEMVKRHMINYSRGPVEDIYITDDCAKVSGSPRLWQCESKTGFFTMIPKPRGEQPFFQDNGPTVEQESTGEMFIDNSVHSWLPVNDTYHYRNGDYTADGIRLSLSNVATGDWLAFSFPTEEPFEPSTEGSVARVDSLEQFYATDDSSIVMYYDTSDNIQYIKAHGYMSVGDDGVPRNKGGARARFG